MPTPLMDASVLREALRALAVAGGNITDAARSLGIPRTTLRDRLKQAWRRGIPLETPEKPRYRVPASSQPTTAETWLDPRRAALRGEIGGPPIPDIAKPPEGFIITRNGGAYDESGNLLRQWVQSKRDAGEEYAIPAGHVVKGESALVDPDGRVVAKWIKTKEGAGEGLIDALREVFGEYEGRAGEIPAPLHTDDDLLTVYPLADLHMGLYSWGRETGGADYDVDIATKLVINSVSNLISQSRPTKHAIVLALGDLFHTNDQTNATPAHKHRLDADTRWPRIYRAGAQLLTTVIDMVAAKHGQIEVVNLPGNHDPDSSVCLTVALGMFYANNPRIDVYEEPGLFWYRRFGKCLLGATHGHTVKASAAMAMIMAADRPRDWGETEFRTFYSGHIHQDSVKEIGSVRVETFTTPAARDAYAQNSGYRSSRAMTAITYHREYGEIGRHRVNITTPTPDKMAA